MNAPKNQQEEREEAVLASSSPADDIGLLRPGCFEILRYINNNSDEFRKRYCYYQRISDNVKASHSNIFHTLKEFVSLGVLSIEKLDKLDYNVYVLTIKGKKVFEKILRIHDLLGGNNFT